MIFGINENKTKTLMNAMFFFFFFFCAKFPEKCGYFELKRNKDDVPLMPMMCLC